MTWNRRRGVPAGLFVMIALVAGASIVSAHAANKAITAQFSVHDPASVRTVDHGAWQKFIDAYVRAGPDGINRVDYGAVSASDRNGLEAYLKYLTTIEVDKLNRGQQFAYWTNLYNALTVRIVLNAYPVKTIRSIKLGRIFALGPWGQAIIRVDGADLSLDNIEHDILRPIWRDPRIHYVVNCAALGCPNLQATALTADNAEALLDVAARAFINHPRGVTVTPDGLQLSKIFKWYRSDFGQSDAMLLSHLSLYADDDLKQQLDSGLPIGGYGYDWGLNEYRP